MGGEWVSWERWDFDFTLITSKGAAAKMQPAPPAHLPPSSSSLSLSPPSPEVEWIISENVRPNRYGLIGCAVFFHRDNLCVPGRFAHSAPHVSLGSVSTPLGFNVSSTGHGVQHFSTVTLLQTVETAPPGASRRSELPKRGIVVSNLASCFVSRHDVPLSSVLPPSCSVIKNDAERVTTACRGSHCEPSRSCVTRRGTILTNAVRASPIWRGNGAHMLMSGGLVGMRSQNPRRPSIREVSNVVTRWREDSVETSVGV